MLKSSSLRGTLSGALLWVACASATPAERPQPYSTPEGPKTRDAEPPGPELQSVAVGRSHSCALSRGQVFCWGLGTDGQLGPPQTSSYTPRKVEGLPAAAISVAASHNESCALLENGSVHCWGPRPYSDDTAPTEYSLLAGSKRMTLGHWPCVVNRNGHVVCAPHGPNEDAWTLEQSGMVRELFGGGNTLCWISSSQRLTCGSLALGDFFKEEVEGTFISASPSGLQGNSAGVGWSHQCAVASDRTLRCWGSNHEGQLGIEGEHRETPKQVEVGGVLSVTSGRSTTCALLSDRTVRCWGANDRGQALVRASAEPERPAEPPGVGRVTEVRTQGRHTCARRSASEVVCWGANEHGQLGGPPSASACTQACAPTVVKLP